MAIVVVGGSGRGVGKTALVCGLIAALPEFDWAAVKVASHSHGRNEPVWEETTPGNATDTARYLAAGARRALLATAPLKDSPPEPDFSLLLHDLRAMLGWDANILFESNRILDYLQPGLCLMVRAGAEFAVEAKPSFSVAAHHAHAMVERAKTDRLLRGDPASKPVFQLANLELVSPEMQAWLLLKLASAPRP